MPGSARRGRNRGGTGRGPQGLLVTELAEARLAVERQVVGIKSELQTQRPRLFAGREWTWVISAAALGIAVGMGANRRSCRRGRRGD